MQRLKDAVDAEEQKCQIQQLPVCLLPEGRCLIQMIMVSDIGCSQEAFSAVSRDTTNKMSLEIVNGFMSMSVYHDMWRIMICICVYFSPMQIYADDHSTYLNCRTIYPFVLSSSPRCSHVIALVLADRCKIMDSTCIRQACNVELKIEYGFLDRTLNHTCSHTLIFILPKNLMSLMSSEEPKRVYVGIRCEQVCMMS